MTASIKLCYEKAENNSRREFQRLLGHYADSIFDIPDITFTNPDDGLDGWFQWDSTTCYFELKFRNCSISKYSTYILEKSKYSKLVHEHRKGNRAFYVMLFKGPGNTPTAYVFNISRRIDRWGYNAEGVFTPDHQPRSTVEDLGDTEKLTTYLVPEPYDSRLDTSSTGTYSFDY